MQFTYTKEGDEYVWSCDGESRMRGAEIAIAYTEDGDDNVTLHKHGPADAVQEWYDRRRPVFDAIGHRLKMISSAAWDADDLDRFINCTGSLGPWLRRHGLLSSQTAPQPKALDTA